MKHPKSRAERRAVRDGVIARRKFIALSIWSRYDQVAPKWGKYAKFNLNCGCKLCHYEKYFKEKRKRRRALDEAVFENIKSFQEDIEN